MGLHEVNLRPTNNLQKSFSMDHGTPHELRVQRMLARVSSEVETSFTSHRYDLRRVSIGEDDIDAEAEAELEPAPRPRSRHRSRSKSDVGNTKQAPRHRSPYGRLRSSDAIENESPSGYQTQSSRKTESVTAPTTTARAESERGRSPRRSRCPSFMASVVPEEAPVTRKSNRSTSRRRRLAEPPRDAEADTDMGVGDTQTGTNQGHDRLHSRQHRRKASEPVAVAQDVASFFPEDVNYVDDVQVPALHHQEHKIASPVQQHYELHSPAQLHDAAYSFHVPSSSSSPSTTRRATKEVRLLQSSDWMQCIEDIVMWRHIPRSALIFGAGCFFVMSASVIQDMHYSIISFMAYIALFYLGATYIKRSFLRSNTTPVPMPSIYMVTEAEALQVIRVLLPPINLMLQKLGDLFCGEPVVTLKLAGALWLLAKAGSIMNVWSLTRIAYFAIFTVPKCYSSYNYQMQIQARNGLRFVKNLFVTCSHKKAVLCAGLALAWNFSSVSTRVCGAFIALVAVRAFQHEIRSESHLSNNFLDPNQPLRATCADQSNQNSFQIGAGGYELAMQQQLRMVS